MTWKCSITTEYLHDLGMRSLVLLETQYFNVSKGRVIEQFLNMSFSQSEENAKAPPGMNQGDVPYAHRGHFPLTGFAFVYTLQNMWNDSCQPGCSLRLICRPGCGVVSTQARLRHLPLTGKLHTAPPLLIWGSPKGHQCVSWGWGSPVKTQGGEVRVVSADGDVQMKHRQQRSWILITKTAVPTKIAVWWRLCCSAAETLSFCQTGNPFISARKIMFILLFPPLGIIPYEKVL